MNTDRRHFTVLTAGHVDHGKSSLVRALTGTDPDRLPEEKARGITIDLGFAHLELVSPTPSPTTLDIGIIDVPGHEDFVKTMVAGAATVDLVLFVIAADDGWMPQTEEHLQILTYLGVERAVVVLTKVDRVESDEQASVAMVRERLQGSAFEQAPIVPVSARAGRGLDTLKAVLRQELFGAAGAADYCKPRLAIDRAFVLPGVGPVVTGTMRGGWLCQGQEVVIHPGNHSSRIRTLQCFRTAIPSAGPGMRTALSLAHVELHPEKKAGRSPAIRRGQVVTLPGLGQAHKSCDVLVTRLLRPGMYRALKNGTRIRLHTGTSNIPGRIYLSGQGELHPGETCIAQLRLEAEVFAFTGDRYALRDWTERLTLAGGIVLDPCPGRPPRGLKSSVENVVVFGRKNRGTAPQSLTATQAVEAALRRSWVADANRLLTQSVFSPAELGETLKNLNSRGQCELRGAFVFQTEAWSNLLNRARNLIDRHHKTHSEQAGINLTELRAALEMEVEQAGVFECVVSDLLNTGFAQHASTLLRKGHQPSLPAHLQVAASRIRAALSAKPLDPPARPQLAPDPASREALAFLLRSREAVELAPDLVLSERAFNHGRETIREFLHRHGPATVSELRQALNASRRVVVPLLEKLDRDGITRRDGDRRVLNSNQPRGAAATEIIPRDPR